MELNAERGDVEKNGDGASGEMRTGWLIGLDRSSDRREFESNGGKA